MVAGRADASRPPDRQELAATAVLALDLAEVSAKIRSGPVQDEPEDLALAWWAGVVDEPDVRTGPFPRPSRHPGGRAHVASY